MFGSTVHHVTTLLFVCFCRMWCCCEITFDLICHGQRMPAHCSEPRTSPSVFADAPSKLTMSLTVLCRQTTCSNETTVTLLQDLCPACLAIVNWQLETAWGGVRKRSSVIPGKPIDSDETLHHQPKPCIATNIGGEINFVVAADIHSKCHSKPSWMPGNVLGKQNKRMVDWNWKFGKDRVNRHCKNRDDYEIVTKETSR